MRIVHLIWSLNTGGSETMLVDIANKQSLTDEVIVLIGNTFLDHSVLDQLSQKVEVRFCDRPPGSRNPWYLLKLYRILRKLNPDIIHSHLQSFIQILRFLDIPKILTVHATGMRLTSMLNKYDAAYSISCAVKKDLSDRQSEISTTIIHNGINISEVIQKSRYGNSPFRIVQVSRLDHEKKGQDVLLKALPYVNAVVGVGNVTVDFIGEGASKDYLTGLAKELGVDEWCRFLGQRSRGYVYENLHGYDLLVQPSRFEGFGLTIVEAMAAMVPVLISNIEGPMEVIDNGEYGYHFIAEDHEDCAKNIVIVRRQSKLQGFAKERKIIAEYARDRFDVASTAEKYLDEYKKVILRKKLNHV